MPLPRAAASSAAIPAGITSRPIPSPAITAILCVVVVMSHPGRREAAIGGGPSAVGEKDCSGHVAGGVRGEEERRPDHLVGGRPTLQRALDCVGVVPVGVGLDL